MCGRYYRVGDKQAIAEYFASEPHGYAARPPDYNAAPTTTQPVIREGRDTNRRELLGMRWGLGWLRQQRPRPEASHFQRSRRKPRFERIVARAAAQAALSRAGVRLL